MNKNLKILLCSSFLLILSNAYASNKKQWVNFNGNLCSISDVDGEYQIGNFNFSDSEDRRMWAEYNGKPDMLALLPFVSHITKNTIIGEGGSTTSISAINNNNNARSEKINRAKNDTSASCSSDNNINNNNRTNTPNAIKVTSRIGCINYGNMDSQKVEEFEKSRSPLDLSGLAITINGISIASKQGYNETTIILQNDTSNPQKTEKSFDEFKENATFSLDPFSSYGLSYSKKANKADLHVTLRGLKDFDDFSTVDKYTQNNQCSISKICLSYTSPYDQYFFHHHDATLKSEPRVVAMHLGDYYTNATILKRLNQYPRIKSVFIDNPPANSIALLKENNKTLEQVTLNCNVFCCSIENFKETLADLNNHPIVTQLTLLLSASHALSEKTLTQIGDFIQDNKTLKRLRIGGSDQEKISDKDLRLSVSGALECNHSLEYLILQKNMVSNKFMEENAKNLRIIFE